MIFALLAAIGTYGIWNSSHIGGGGYIQNVVLTSDPKTMYCYVDVGGLYRSDDGGQRWKMLHGSLPQGHYEVRSLDVDPRNPRRLVAAIGTQWAAPQGIFFSNDGGESFSQTLRAPFHGNGTFRWTGVVLARHPRNPDVILAGTAGAGVYRSRDGGRTWQARGVANAYVTDIKFDPIRIGQAYVCAQPFKDWLWRDQTSEMVDYPSSFYRSMDSGAAWEKISERSPSELVVEPKSGRLIAILDERVAASVDGGKSWEPFERGLPPGPVGTSYIDRSRFQALATGPDFVLAGAADGSIYRLKGTAWVRVERKSVTEIYRGRPWFRKMGAGWALATLVVDPKNPKRWYWTDWYGIYRTDDSGANWRLQIDGIEATVIHTICPDPYRRDRIIMGMADNGAFQSDDRANRFQTVPGMDSNAKGIAFAHGDRVILTGPDKHEWFANSVFLSDDRGRHFRRGSMRGLPDMNSLRCNSVAASGPNAWLGVSGAVGPGKGGAYRSEDGGESWKWAGEGLPADGAFFRESIWQGGRELAVSRDGSVVAISIDGGRVAHRTGQDRWQLATVDLAGNVPTDVATNPHRTGEFLIGLRNFGGLLRSTDGGRHWRRLPVKGGGPVAYDPFAPNRIACATVTGPAISDDAGLSWRSLGQKLPHKDLTSIGLSAGRIVVGTSGSGVFYADLPRSPAR